MRERGERYTEKDRAPSWLGAGPFHYRPMETESGSGDVFGLEAFRPLLDLKLNHLTVGEGFVAIHLDRGEMDEDVLSGLALDESIAF